MKAVRHTGIAVSDLEQSLHFYCDLLDLKVVKEADEGGEYISKLCSIPEHKANIKTVKLALDDTIVLELIWYEYYHNVLNTKSDIYCTRTCHIAFQVEDVEIEYRRLLNARVEFLSEPQFSPDNYAKVVFCRDPDGIYIELVEVL